MEFFKKTASHIHLQKHRTLSGSHSGQQTTKCPRECDLSECPEPTNFDIGLHGAIVVANAFRDSATHLGLPKAFPAPGLEGPKTPQAEQQVQIIAG